MDASLIPDGAESNGRVEDSASLSRWRSLGVNRLLLVLFEKDSTGPHGSVSMMKHAATIESANPKTTRPAREANR